MSRKQITILIALIAVVVIGIIVGILTRTSEPVMPVSNNPPVGNNGNVSNPSVPPLAPPTYTPEVPKNAVQTLPKAEAPASSNPELDTKLKFFDLKASNSGFNPNAITVKKGDSLQVDFTAVDGDYDLNFPYLGAYFSVVRRGVTKRLPLDTSLTGTFTFECRDFCPPGKKIQGQLIVLP